MSGDSQYFMVCLHRMTVALHLFKMDMQRTPMRLETKSCLPYGTEQLVCRFTVQINLLILYFNNFIHLRMIILYIFIFGLIFNLL